ncbi:hypothetical protein [Stenotrophomonas rhizophila]|uniref:hypothetical protein n=1 Tax=Stenotrophomonas rhizophila TaxID=216778 RepID=UPI001E2B5581|nr:hypothetical protein [Stenotrophomonas rhizophila]MCC7633972.1 methionyl-tRNA formyltransferase [Stenotrophomonas rhizophila]MCC7663306.1 methionyl-tRNA formyltransferase [Stenotrophomonas rhizophila]
MHILPAIDWYFVHDGAGDNAEPVAWDLVAWGLTDAGELIGLVDNRGCDSTLAGTQCLVAVPPVRGRYLHRSQRAGPGVPRR